MLRIASLSLLLLVSPASSGEKAPRFDIDAMCRAAPRLPASDQTTFQDCVRDETAARSQLDQHWASFDTRQREVCAQETVVGGAPSYVEVLTCIQIASGNNLPFTPSQSRRKP